MKVTQRQVTQFITVCHMHSNDDDDDDYDDDDDNNTNNINKTVCMTN